MDNLTAGNPVAHRVRVYYEGSNTIYEGMALSYNYDTTTNWFGGSVSDGVVTASTTTSAGTHNEGKYIRVEEPSSANQIVFAGVVAKGGWCGRTGPRILDIYVPNGAIVQVYTDKSIVARDKLYLEDGANTLVNAVQVGMLDCVAIATETIDRSTAGLVQAKLLPVGADNLIPGTLGIAPSELLWVDCPWKEIDGNPGIGITYFDDFTSAPNLVSGEGWTITQIPDAGTLKPVADEGGALILDTDNTSTVDQGVQAQLLSCRFKPVAASTIWFEARVKVADATDQWFVGLCATDTSIFAGGSIDNNTDRAGFYHAVDGADNKVGTVTERGSACDATIDTAAFTDGAYKTIGFRISGLTKIEFYVNGVLVETGETTTNIPNAAMCLSLAAIMEVTGAAEDVTVDWVKIAQLGARA